MYYLNWVFDLKMVLLLLAIIFNYTIHRKTALSGKSPAWNKAVACVSIALWVGVIFGGIFLAFI
jgi:ABC-type iron transport system FetAB permease component